MGQLKLFLGGVIGSSQFWIKTDRGLRTRAWEEAEPSFPLDFSQLILSPVIPSCISDRLPMRGKTVLRAITG